MALQLELPIAPETQTLVALTMHVLMEREWVTPAEIQKAIYAKTSEWHSDSSITARIRDQRKDEYGAHIIEKRLREGSRAWEYRCVA